MTSPLPAAETPLLPKPMMLLIALIQGLLLFILHESIEFKFWPYGAPQWLFPFYTLVIVLPLTLLLSIESDNGQRLLRWFLPFSLITACLAFYMGYQALPTDQVRMQELLFGFIATLAIATFKVLMYAQQQAAHQAFTYSNLYRYSWRNFLTLILGLMFMGAVWGILRLSASLFEAINIDFFDELLEQRWFYYPTLALALAFGLIISRNLFRVIDTIARLQQALMKFLLVILVSVSLSFLLALPFTGLTPLWQTGHGSILILWLQALMLFFANAVYQDDASVRPYPLAIHRFIYLGLAVLPVYSVIAFYGLSVRVEQYGWTVGRCWGFLIWGLLALFSLGYLLGIVQLRDRWLERLSWVNVRMGLVLLAAMLLVNSPLLDFRKITVRDQLGRLERGLTPLEDFSFYYFRDSLARPGYEALQKMRADLAETRPEIAAKIDSLYGRFTSASPTVEPVDREAFFRALQWHQDEPLPVSLQDSLYARAQTARWPRDSSAWHLLKVDMNSDGRDDYVLLRLRGCGLEAELFTYEGDQWRQLDMKDECIREPELKRVKDLLRENQFETVIPEWRWLRIGDLTLEVRTP